MPGPGNYMDQNTFGQGKGFKIGEKQKDMQILNVPGPGSYSQNEFYTKTNA